MTINLRDTMPSISIPPPRKWWNDDGNEVPIRYQVMVMKQKIIQSVPRRSRWEHMMGTIVTHLSVEDYCQLHGLKLMEVYHGTRHALPHERTELF